MSERAHTPPPDPSQGPAQRRPGTQGLALGLSQSKCPETLAEQHPEAGAAWQAGLSEAQLRHTVKQRSRHLGGKNRVSLCAGVPVAWPPSRETPKLSWETAPSCSPWLLAVGTGRTARPEWCQCLLAHGVEPVPAATSGVELPGFRDEFRRPLPNPHSGLKCCQAADFVPEAGWAPERDQAAGSGSVQCQEPAWWRPCPLTPVWRAEDHPTC